MEEQIEISRPDKAIKFVAYVCFAMAIIVLLRLVALPGFVVSMLILFFSALWYQSGVGLIKGRKYSGWLAGVLLSLVLIQLTWVVFGAFNTMFFKDNATLVGYAHWVFFVLWLINISSLYILLKKEISKWLK